MQIYPHQIDHLYGWYSTLSLCVLMDLLTWLRDRDTADRNQRSNFGEAIYFIGMWVVGFGLLKAAAWYFDGLVPWLRISVFYLFYSLVIWVITTSIVQVSKRSVNALKFVRRRRALKELIRGWYWEQAVETLDSLGWRPNVRTLGRVLENTPSGDARIYAMRQMVRLCDPNAVEPLKKVAIRHRDSSMRTIAGESLAELLRLSPAAAKQFERNTMKSLLAITLNVIRDREGSVSSDEGRRAAKLLALCGGETVVESLVEALSDSRPLVRINATEALTEVGNIRSERSFAEAAEGPFIRMLTEESPVARSLAASALGLQRSAKAVDSLIQLLGDAELGVAKSAVHALANIGDARAVEPLARLLEDSRLQLDAVRALEKLGDSGAIIPLICVLEKFEEHGWADFIVTALESVLGASAPSATVEALQMAASLRDPKGPRRPDLSSVSSYPPTFTDG